MEYTTKADEYKRLLPELENKEEVESKIKALQFLGEADRPTQQALFDAGAFNNIVLGYVLLSLEELNYNDYDAGRILNAISNALNEVSSQEAEHYYLVKG